MALAKSLTLLGAFVMLAALTYGFALGDFWGDGRVLVSVPWGRVSLLDVYVGFGLFCGWIAFRERSWAHAAAWILIVLTLGNLLACLYAFRALAGSQGNWARFWMGARAEDRPRAGGS
jgi:Protein of unknown function (DUF1475)